MSALFNPKPADGLFRVGVYGTLKAGFFRHNALKGARQQGLCYIDGIMVHRTQYPALVHNKPGIKYLEHNSVGVEVYDVDQDVLDELDRIEGHPSLFERRVVKTASFGDMFVYFMHTDKVLKDKVRVIIGNKWQGIETPFVWVEYKEGHDKPHVGQTKRVMRKLEGGQGYEEVFEGTIVTGGPYNPGYQAPSYPKKSPYTWDQSLHCYTDVTGKRYRKATYSDDYTEIIEVPIEPPSVITVPKQDALTHPFPNVISL